MKLLPLALGLLALGAACAGHRALETRINGRPAQTVRAEAVRVEGGWEVTLPLPAGRWTAHAETEPVTLRQVDGPVGKLLRWNVPDARWGQDRPFPFRLEGEQGTALTLEVRYGALAAAPRVLLNIAYALASGKVVWPN